MFNHRIRNLRISDGSIIHTEKFFGSVQEFNGCENKDSVKHDLELMTHPDYLNDILTDNTLPTHHPFISEDRIKENGCDIVQCKYEKGSADEFTQDPGNSTATVTDAESALLGYALKSMCGAKVYKVSSYIDLFFSVGYYNEDEFITYKAVYLSGKIAITSDVLYYYYQHTAETGSITKS